MKAEGLSSQGPHACAVTQGSIQPPYTVFVPRLRVILQAKLASDHVLQILSLGSMNLVFFLFCFCIASSGKHKPKHNIFSQIRPSKRHIVGVKKLANPDNNKYYVTAQKGGSEAKKAIGQKSNISLRMTI